MKLNKKHLILLTVILLLLSACQQQGLPDNQTGNNVETEPKNDPKATSISIDSLNIGDKVVDSTWTWEFRRDYGYVRYNEDDVTAPVTWIVVAKDHYNGGVTLLSEYLIGYYYFDTSMLDSGLVAGWGHWGGSGTGNANNGIRPWLNSIGIHSDEGFYDAFSENFKSIVLSTEVPNREYTNGEAYTTNDFVFIPSSTELGASEYDGTYEIGSTFEYFADSSNADRVTKIYMDYSNKSYWLRNPMEKGYRAVGIVFESGFFSDYFSDFNSFGVRPALNISSNAQVSSIPNIDGYYEIIYN